MFKIENFIAPLIEEQLSKYVRNFNAQDFQISLWQGEVSFQNLELRLEEIEEEFDLPFHLVSGHINELTIEIPWKKILSEAIRININTIEFVLKTKELRKEPNQKSAKISNNKEVSESTDSSSSTDSVEKKDDDSYVIRLGKRIINNIHANCENIILKYIEQDIVCSLNLNLFDMCAANDKWKPSVEDINTPKVISRKLINVYYLTLCIDKQNASGQIDTCLEPLLYRCSLECRILRSFTAQTKDKCSTTRIGVYTSAIDLNLSSMQIPMLMRFIKTILELIDSKKKFREMRLPCQNEKPTHYIGDDNANEGENENETPRTTYLAWAWNFVPNVLTRTAQAEDAVYCPGHIKEFGIYIKQLNFTIKNSEYGADGAVNGALVINYKPIIQLIFNGMYFERVNVKEIDWKNIKIGIANFVIKPLETDEKNMENSNILDMRPMKNTSIFYDKSLFDDDCKTPAQGWIVTNYDDYMKRFTDVYLLRRTPAFAFDHVQFCSDIEEMDEDINASVSANIEKSCLHKQTRVMGTGVVLRYNEKYLKKKSTTPIFEFTTCTEHPPPPRARSTAVASSETK